MESAFTISEENLPLMARQSSSESEVLPDAVGPARSTAGKAPGRLGPFEESKNLVIGHSVGKRPAVWAGKRGIDGI